MACRSASMAWLMSVRFPSRPNRVSKTTARLDNTPARTGSACWSGAAALSSGVAATASRLA